MEKYAKQVEEMLNEHTEAMNALGEKVRKEVVTPFCRKYKMTYTSGMGTFFFSKGKKDYHVGDDVPKGELGRELEKILELLNMDIAYNDCLGYRVGDAP